MHTQFYQVFDDVLMTRIRPKCHNRMRNHGADILNRVQIIDTRRHHRIQCAIGFGQGFRRGLTDMANAERVNQPRQCGRFGGLNRVKYILRRFFSHALQPRQLRHRQAIQIIGGFNQTHIDHLLNQFVTQTIDVDCFA